MSDDFASLSLPELRYLAVRLGISLEHADDRDALLEEIEDSWDDYGSFAHNVSFTEIMRTKFGFSTGRDESIAVQENLADLMPIISESVVDILMRGPSWGLVTWRLAIPDQDKKLYLRIYEVADYSADSDFDSRRPLSQVDLSIPEGEQNLFLHFSKPGSWYRVGLIDEETNKVVAVSLPCMTVGTTLLDNLDAFLVTPAQLKFLLAPMLRNEQYRGSNSLISKIFDDIAAQGGKWHD